MKCKFHRPTSITHLVCNTKKKKKKYFFILYFVFFDFKKNPKQKYFCSKDREIKHEDHEVQENLTDSSLLDLQSTSSHAYDFEIPLNGFRSPIIVDLVAAT